MCVCVSCCIELCCACVGRFFPYLKLYNKTEFKIVTFWIVWMDWNIWATLLAWL